MRKLRGRRHILREYRSRPRPGNEELRIVNNPCKLNAQACFMMAPEPMTRTWRL